MSRTPTGRRTPAQSSGFRAEESAAHYLEERGLRIVARNYRTRFGEIDLIAQDAATLVFVEVRLRADGRYGGAAESIDHRKIGRIVAAARSYLAGLRHEPPCRFDVVTVEGPDSSWLRGAFEVD